MKKIKDFEKFSENVTKTMANSSYGGSGTPTEWTECTESTIPGSNGMGTGDTLKFGDFIGDNC